LFLVCGRLGVIFAAIVIAAVPISGLLLMCIVGLSAAWIVLDAWRTGIDYDAPRVHFRIEMALWVLIVLFGVVVRLLGGA
jgi:hypothetical protein